MQNVDLMTIINGLAAGHMINAEESLHFVNSTNQKAIIFILDRSFSFKDVTVLKIQLLVSTLLFCVRIINHSIRVF